MSIFSEELTKLLPSYLLNSQNYSVVITDLEGKYMFVNKLFKERFSFIATDFIGVPFQCTIYEEDIEKCNQAAAYCITHPNETVSLMLRKPEKDFLGFYWTSWEFSLFKDQNGQAIGILCIGHDVTEQVAVQEQLAYSESKLKSILDSSESGNMLVSPELKILVLNRTIKKFARLFLDKGIEEGEDIEQYLYVLKDRGEKFKKSFQEALAGRRIETEEKLEGLNGQIYNFAVAYYPAYNERGYTFGVAISVIDISKQKEAEIALRKTKQRLEILASNFPDGSISLIDKDLIFLYTGGAMYKDYELNPLQWVGKPIHQLFPSNICDKVRALLPSVLEGHHCTFETIFLAKTFLNTIQPIINDEGQVESFVLASIDITERKKKEEQINERNRILEEIAWTQSHEVRQPVANILGLIELIKMEKQQKGEKIIPYLDHLEKATEYLDKIIHKIVAKTHSVLGFITILCST